MLFGKNRTPPSVDASDTDSDAVLVMVRLPKAIHTILQNIAQQRAWLGIDAVELSDSDLVVKAATIYAKEYATNTGAVLNDAMLADSPIAKLTNAIFVHAIQNQVFELDVPLESEFTLSKMGLPPFPSHICLQIVYRLQRITIPESGTISIEHNNLSWTIHIAYTSNPGEYPVAQVRIVPGQAQPAASDKGARD